MTESDLRRALVVEPELVSTPRPSRRDWAILPLLSLLTAVVLLFGSEFLARRIFPTPRTSTSGCLVMDDPATGVRAKPNTTCVQDKWETDDRHTAYHFNNSGHRAGMEMLPKPPGVYRIVLVGSSMSMGLWVPFEQTFGAQLPQELQRITGRPIQLYSEGMQWGSPHNVVLQLKNVIAAKPDLVLWPITPWDVEHVDLSLPTTAPEFKPPSGWAAVQDFADTRVRIVFLLRHVLYMSQSEFLRHFLMQGSEAAFLQADPTPEWRGHLQHLGADIEAVEKQTRPAGVPLVVTTLPERAQADLISLGNWPRGLNPYKFGEQVRSVVEREGGIYVDILDGFRDIPNPGSHYLPVDGHPDPRGYRIFARLLTKALTSGSVPSLARHGAPQQNASIRKAKGF